MVAEPSSGQSIMPAIAPQRWCYKKFLQKFFPLQNKCSSRGLDGEHTFTPFFYWLMYGATMLITLKISNLNWLGHELPIFCYHISSSEIRPFEMGYDHFDCCVWQSPFLVIVSSMSIIGEISKEFCKRQFTVLTSLVIFVVSCSDLVKKRMVFLNTPLPLW